MEKGDFEKRMQTKRMRLPVYHSPTQKEKTITIKLKINPRLLERLFFITIILCLLAIIIVQPDWIFNPSEKIETTQTGISAAAPAAMQTEEPPEANTTATDQQVNTSSTDQQVNTTQTDPQINTTSPQVSTTKEKMDPTKIAFQIIDFTVEKKSETWYKILGVKLKVSNNGGEFKPSVKVWYYDDATKSYFNEASQCKDQQAYSIGIKKGETKTFNLHNLDESFSGKDLNPTIIAKLYDLNTGKAIKEITEKIDWDESDFD